MANKLYDETDIQNIANAIRNKNGSQATYTVSQMASAIENIPSGGGENPLDYFTELSNGGGSVSTLFAPKLIKKIPDNIQVSSSATGLQACFRYCSNLVEVGAIDTTGITNMNQMFNGCSSLITVPVFNTASVNTETSGIYAGFDNMFQNCTSLSNDSLNNILKMMANATSYQGTKTLAQIGLTSAQATTCQGLSNYADFVAAGWTTGY